jgi:hypothetical protein
LAPEEDIGLALLRELGPAGRSVAVVASEAPADIRTATRPRAQPELLPLGIPATGLGLTARAQLDELVALYLDRLVPALADREADRIADAEVYFAWEGPTTPGTRYYYRVQSDDLLIEYDNTDDGNHAHTVLRRPHSDFGDDILAAHYGQDHAP